MSPQGDRRFHHEVDDLVAEVVRMAALSRRSVVDGVAAFAALDAAKARDVIALDDEIDRLDVSIEARSLDLLALNQPMAIDLRRIGACLKIVTYLDRIGRYGYDVAHAALALEGKAHVKKLVGIPLMCDRVVGLLDDAVEAFRTADAPLARGVRPGDDAVDALYEQIFRECVAYMVEDPRAITACAQYILVARHLERVGDNAGKIAEKALYVATGERRLAVDGNTHRAP